MICNMLKLFYMLFLFVNNNNNDNILNKNYEKSEDILFFFLGMDFRNCVMKEISIDVIIENKIKYELLQNLISNNSDIYKKIDMINKIPIVMDNIQVNEIQELKMKKGGLMNDWDFEDFSK